MSTMDRAAKYPARFALMILLCSGAVLADPADPAEAADAGDPGPRGPQVNWIGGPGDGPLGSVARVKIPEGFVFANADDTRTLMEAMHNPTSGAEMGFVAPEAMNWFVVFEYDASGHVKDDDKAELDADAILASLRESQAEGNKARRRKGWETLEITGWMQAPHYDPASNNLEWAPRLRASDGGESVNYNARLLGREGVMSATLVGSEQDVIAGMDAFRSILAGFEFVQGQRYAEFRAGDKVAKYGLTALITGGAAAVALKTGLLQKFWKVIVVGLVAGVAALRRLFGKGKGTSPEGSTPA